MNCKILFDIIYKIVDNSRCREHQSQLIFKKMVKNVKTLERTSWVSGVSVQYLDFGSPDIIAEDGESYSEIGIARNFKYDLQGLTKNFDLIISSRVTKRHFELKSGEQQFCEAHFNWKTYETTYSGSYSLSQVLSELKVQLTVNGKIVKTLEDIFISSAKQEEKPSEPDFFEQSEAFHIWRHGYGDA